MIRTGGRSVGIALAALVAIALAASPALAKKKSSKPGSVKTASATVNTTADDQVATAVATCPGKSKVVGGGFVMGTLNEGGSSMSADKNEVLESRREGEKAWRVTALREDEPFNGGGPAGPALPVTAEAYCRSKPGKISEVAVTETLNAIIGTADLSPAAPCGFGRTIVGGGFSVTQPDNVSYSNFLTESRPLGGVGWDVFSTAGGGTDVSATAYAYCRKASKPLRQTSASGPMPPADNGTVNAIDTPACPGKRTALAGGFRTDPYNSGNGVPNWVESRRAGKSWHVSTTTSHFTPTSFSAFALCG